MITAEEYQDIKSAKRKLMQLKIHRLMNEQHRYYTPIGKVESFIDELGTGKYIVGLLSAANSIGKTYAGANMLANLFWPVDNKFFQQKIFKDWPYPKRGRIISDPTTVTKTIIPTLKEVFPKGRFSVEKYSTTKQGKQFESSWKTDTGWEFDIMTYDQSVKEFESATLGWIWCDEPPPQLIYKASIARFRLGGVMWITATPLTGSAWMYDEIITNVDNETGFRFFEQAELEDACIEHGVRGFLKHDNIMKQVAQYNAEDRQARVFGKFQHLTGVVFKKWKRSIHVIKPFRLDKRDYSVVTYLDPHPRNPDAVMLVAYDKYGRKFVVDEIFKNFDSTAELAAAIKQKEFGHRIVERYADPAAWLENQHHAGRSDVNSLAVELEDEGLEFDQASKQRTMGIRLVTSALNYQLVHEEVGDRFTETPDLYVFEHCIRTIYEFEHWQWQEWTGKTIDKKSKSEKPQDKDDHMMENLGRAFLNDPGFIKYIPIRQKLYTGPLSTGSNRPIHDPTNLDPYS